MLPRRMLVIVCLLAVAVLPFGSAAASPPTETLSAGDNYTCGLNGSSQLHCWGDVPLGAPAASTTFSQISGGGAHVCAILSSGTNNLTCWGDDTFGQTDNVPSGTATQVSAGWVHSCAVIGGGVQCWGNTVGDLGSATDYTQVTVGSAHQCAIHGTDGSIECTGGNGHGQVDPDNLASNPADRTFTDGPYQQVEAGYFYTCALKTSGAVKCWGDNTYNESSPVPSDTDFTQISAGWYHACGLHSGGTITCWGDNTYNESSPVPSEPFTQVAAGQDHTCGLRTTGTWVCWGHDVRTWLRPYTISGYAGIGGLTINYTGGTSFHTDTGNYSFAVPGEWNGTLTPTKPLSSGVQFLPPIATAYEFSPASIHFDGVGGDPAPVTADVSSVNFSATTVLTAVFQSLPGDDGWILATNGNNTAGGLMNSSSPYLQVGDDAINRQYRSVLSFDTGPWLPATLTIRSAQLRLLSFAAPKPNVFIGMGNLTADISDPTDLLLGPKPNGKFGTSYSLERIDFGAASGANAVTGSFSQANGWYSASLNATGINNINVHGPTQFRLRFTIPTNRNYRADYLRFLSGNAGPDQQPQLVVVFTSP